MTSILDMLANAIPDTGELEKAIKADPDKAAYSDGAGWIHFKRSYLEEIIAIADKFQHMAAMVGNPAEVAQFKGMAASVESLILVADVCKTEDTPKGDSTNA